ncbi:MAG: prepilin-type N-terminal cleavage/methylation domain-containing protein [Candidatus Riflebacteria bacterium]|nr:prepilin-type N-terminal cleavage/methylation domain-containing protein [Candidatus Riflebacteria bacterium]
MKTNKHRQIRCGVTLIELLVSVSLMVVLSTAIYTVLTAVRKSYVQAGNKLDILQTTRIIMAGLRNELRNATAKPEITEGKLHIPYLKGNKTQVAIYYFDEPTRRLFRGEKSEMSQPDPDVKEMRPFMLDDGQILKFEYDTSYRDANAFAESELMLNSKVWVKVTMKILYTEKFKTLSEAEKKKILEDPNDPRVKSFFMMITPRRMNWLLQATQ